MGESGAINLKPLTTETQRKPFKNNWFSCFSLCLCISVVNGFLVFAASTEVLQDESSFRQKVNVSFIQNLDVRLTWRALVKQTGYPSYWKSRFRPWANPEPAGNPEWRSHG
jgi:hypothetical protein